MKYAIELEYLTTASLVIEANSKKEAKQKWLDGDYDDREIELDEELFGGIPWSMTKVVALNSE